MPRRVVVVPPHTKIIHDRSVCERVQAWLLVVVLTGYLRPLDRVLAWMRVLDEKTGCKKIACEYAGDRI